MSSISTAEPSAQSSARIERKSEPTLLSWQSFTTLRRAWRTPAEELDADEAASTLFRFFRSEHVIDLKLIFGLTLVALSLHLILALSLVRFGSLATYFGPAVPVYGAILAWAYVTATKRLGIVDLFACEITTLCRVGSILATGDTLVGKYERNETHFPKLTSEEEYFPVFTSNSGDLEDLEAMVVSYITEFYTYMKAMRDSRRALTEIDPSQAKPALANVIYMLFLAYESARKAITHLIEFQPTQAGDIMSILLTELTCYSFLCKHFANDQLRFARLTLRLADYKKEVFKVIAKVETRDDNDKDWGPAKRTLAELEKRFTEMLRALQEVQENYPTSIKLIDAEMLAYLKAKAS